MKKQLQNLMLTLLFLNLMSTTVFAQKNSISGIVINKNDGSPISGITVLLSNKQGTISNEKGYYQLSNIENGNYEITFSSITFAKQTKKVILKSDIKLDIVLAENSLNLPEISISDNSINGINAISKVDLALRPTNSAQDLLRLVPGLFIAQHAGGGKAEQIFLRGFDVDHGTDFAVSIDGMPVNMVSHAHGQGYADMHWMIAETVQSLQVDKGPHEASNGDFATSGAGKFTTINYLDKNVIRLEYGRFNTARGLIMVDLLKNAKLFGNRNESAIIAAEYLYTDAYFDASQNFNRMNIFGKYVIDLDSMNTLSLNLSTFSSEWDASGQIPQRGIDAGSIDRFGSIDNTEGGKTSRTNANLILTSRLKNNGTIKNQLFYSKYDFKLYSNFTFFLDDSINGDQLEQIDDRSICGYKFTLNNDYFLGRKKISQTFGAGLRYDDISLNLSKSVKRNFISDIVRGNIKQLNAYAYLDENIEITPAFFIKPGVRFDYFNFTFDDKLLGDSTGGEKNKSRISPKLQFQYIINQDVELFAKASIGFHSNDARGVVLGKQEETLPRAYGYEVGSLFKPSNNTVMQIALWGLDLESELVYVGDGGFVEASGATRRLGVDFAIRQQIMPNLFADMDLNYNYGRLLNVPKNEDNIPLAPRFTSIAGISYKKETGFNGGIRYRAIGDRPANENNTVTAKGYFIVDGLINYTQKKYELGLSAENIFNVDWNEAQFDTESRLQGENEPVSELHFTPGTPFFFKGRISFFF